MRSTVFARSLPAPVIPAKAGIHGARKCAKRPGVRRLDAAFAHGGSKVARRRAVAAPESQGGVKPPQSKAPSAHRYSEQQ